MKFGPRLWLDGAGEGWYDRWAGGVEPRGCITEPFRAEIGTPQNSKLYNRLHPLDGIIKLT